MKTKRVFIICPVRLADEKINKKLDEYVANLERQGIIVHLPKRDTVQTNTPWEICTQNMNAIKKADEVHILYSAESQGSHFDLGVSFCLGKPLKLIDIVSEKIMKGKSVVDLLTDWQQRIPVE